MTDEILASGSYTGEDLLVADEYPYYVKVSSFLSQIVTVFEKNPPQTFEVDLYLVVVCFSVHLVLGRSLCHSCTVVRLPILVLALSTLVWSPSRPSGKSLVVFLHSVNFFSPTAISTLGDTPQEF